MEIRRNAKTPEYIVECAINDAMYKFDHRKKYRENFNREKYMQKVLESAEKALAFLKEYQDKRNPDELIPMIDLSFTPTE